MFKKDYQNYYDEEEPSWFKSLGEFVLELIRVVVISLAIIIPVRYFLIQPFYVKGASMEPNFYDHEYLIVDEISYRLNNPERGEIVVFRYPRDPKQYFIKRIVGLPGEKIEVKGGQVYVYNKDNPMGVVLVEDYLGTNVETPGNELVVLGEGEYFVLGDNRSSSLDSRGFGAIPKELIVGRAWFRGWPFDKIKVFEAPSYKL